MPTDSLSYPVLAKIQGCFIWSSRSIMLGSAKSENPRLIIREIIVKVVQLIGGLYDHNTSTSRTDRGQTYGRLLYHDNRAVHTHTASRGKNSVTRKHY